MSNPPNNTTDLVHVEILPIRVATERDLEHAHNLAREARATPFYRTVLDARLRALIRYLRGVWTLAQVVEARTAGVDSAEVKMHLDDEIARGPRAAEPLEWAASERVQTEECVEVSRARQACEAAWTRGEKLRCLLSWRLLVHAHKRNASEAVAVLGVSLNEWAAFCAAEDARDPGDDGVPMHLDFIDGDPIEASSHLTGDSDVQPE